MIEPRPINRVTCPVCSRPERILSKHGRINQHNDPRKPFTGPLSQQCEASGMFLENARKLGES